VGEFDSFGACNAAWLAQPHLRPRKQTDLASRSLWHSTVSTTPASKDTGFMPVSARGETGVPRGFAWLSVRRNASPA
jgi:hypothetical protein